MGGDGLRHVGNLLILVGVIAILAGMAARFGLLSWFGALPGDIRRVGQHSAVFVPITSMVLLSIILTVLVNLIGRFFRG